MNHIFKIPVMSIQDVAVELYRDPRIVHLHEWLTKKVKEKRYQWGIKGKGFRLESDLERQWYPIFIIPNRWLADEFVKYLGKYKPWNRKRDGTRCIN